MKRILLFLLFARAVYGYTECDDTFLWRPPCSINVQVGVPLLGTWDFTNATVLGIGGGSTCITCSGTDGQVAIWNTGLNQFVAGDPIVSGPDAPGSAPTKNPVQIGSYDGTNIQRIKSDTSGNLNVNVLGTVPISGVVSAAQSGAWSVTANAGTNLNTSSLALDTSVNGLLLSQGSTTSGEKGPLDLGAVTSSAPSYTTGQSDPLSLNTSGGLRVDGSGVTQPVSGTVTANAGAGTFTISGTVTANAGTNLNTSSLALDTSVNGLLLAQASTTSGEKGPIIQGAVTTSAPSYTTAQTDPLSLTTAGALRVDGSAVTQPVSGTVTANAGTGNFNENLAQVAGSTVSTAATGIQKVGATGATGSSVDILGFNNFTTTNADAWESLIGIWNGATAVRQSSSNGRSAAVSLDRNANLFTEPAMSFNDSNQAWTSATGINTAYVFLDDSASNAVGSGDQQLLIWTQATSTFTAGAITFEVTYDGTNWVALPTDTVLDPTAAGFASLTNPYTIVASTNKPFLIHNRGGWQGIRVRLSTAITGTGTFTFNGQWQPESVIRYVEPLGTALPVTLATGGNTITQNVNVNQIAGVGPAITLGGFQKIAIFGNSAVALDAATGSAVPANALLTAGRAATANPTNATGGNLTGIMTDKAGRVVTTNAHVRDLVAVQSTTISASASETTIVTAGASGVFNDITQLVITNSGSATCNWTLKDATAGTTRGIYDMPATVGTSLVIQFNPPLPQSTAANNWTITCSTATSTGAHIQVVFIKNT